ncbi:MAG TPA: alpha/beta fold hydrolase, partial [Roseateles sp.]
MTAALWARVATEFDEPARRPGDTAPSQAPVLIPIQQRRRRGFDKAAADGRAAVRLLRDDDGQLRWVYEPPAHQYRSSDRRAWRQNGADPPETVQRIAFPELGDNAVTAKLMALDCQLNPALDLKQPTAGLRRWDREAKAWAALPEGFLAGLKGRVLVLVHGTFSASGMYARELAATVDGETLLARLADPTGTYAAVLAFDHPTLSVGPWLNALALRDALAECPAEFDFVGHSRGGLVIAWLLRMAPELRARQAIFVGSPLAGTSLAAPDKLRQAQQPGDDEAAAAVADEVELGRALGQRIAQGQRVQPGADGQRRVVEGQHGGIGTARIGQPRQQGLAVHRRGQLPGVHPAGAERAVHQHQNTALEPGEEAFRQRRPG